MPNHVKNIVKIEGIENLLVFKEEDGEKQEIIMNHSFIKNDEELKILFVRVMEKVCNATEPKRNEMYQMGQTYVEDYQKYGYTTWYDWCIANWGAKWNAYCNERVDENTISFKTAWSNPESVMLKLSKMYLETVIEHWWADEYVGMNVGHRSYYKGIIVDGGFCDECSEEAYTIFAKCWED